ncbi:MAG: hypothetical protein LBI36_02505 [Oscillospiraceae bacterium]|jgi:hypothetical protein|nr:hypothetical protein [Oscillospiraceae bacterium]
MKKKIFSAVLAVIIAFTAIPGITAGAAAKKIKLKKVSAFGKRCVKTFSIYALLAR